ncbi:DNA polymerase III subunit delta [Novosphingobium sp.]|uniref:DNA polymerase III subunit delta n=1 Tax=Novosphingobium sp. TaxID=1874826 RepID=UPI00333FCBBE
MKATQKTFGSTLDRNLRKARVLYFCGSDQAGAADAAALALERLQPAELVEFTGAELKADPMRLADEARSSSLFADRRVIRVAMAGDEAHDAVVMLMADTVPGWPVLLVASAASDKSRVAKLLVDRDDALVAMFYPPDLATISGAVRTQAEALGLRMNDGLAEAIAQAATLDSRIVRSELEKLALYLDAARESPKTVTPEDLAAIGAETGEDSMTPLVNAALGGMVDRVARELPKLAAGDINAVGLLLAFERRAVQLTGLAARLGSATNVSAFMEREMQSRRVFFKDKPDLMLQLQKWRGPRIERLVTRLAALHRDMLTNSPGAQVRLQQAIIEIARASAR